MRTRAHLAQHVRQKYSLVDFHAFLVALQPACIFSNLVGGGHQARKGIGRGLDQVFDPEKPGIILRELLVDGSHMPLQEALSCRARFLSDGFGGVCLLRSISAAGPERTLSCPALMARN